MDKARIEPPTPFERFRAAVKQVLSVPKEELEKREKEWKKKREKKRHANSRIEGGA